MSINMNPDMYAQQFATQNNLSLEEAKKQLREKHGDPSRDNNSIFPQNNNNSWQPTMDVFNSSTGTQGIGTQNKQPNQFGIQQKQDPDTYAQQYANENGLTLDEAKAELKATYGDPRIANIEAEYSQYEAMNKITASGQLIASEEGAENANLNSIINKLTDFLTSLLDALKGEKKEQVAKPEVSLNEQGSEPAKPEAPKEPEKPSAPQNTQGTEPAQPEAPKEPEKPSAPQNAQGTEPAQPEAPKEPEKPQEPKRPERPPLL